MRPAATRQGAFAAPLNDILGTEASVRVLRALAKSSVPLSRGDIARETALHPSGIPRVLDRLENLGVIERIGRSRSQPFRLRDRNLLVRALRELFTKEAQRVTDVRQRINQVLSHDRIDAAWIEGPVARNSDETADPIVVGLLAPSDFDEASLQHFRAGFNGIQRDHDVAIEMRVRTRADIAAATDAERSILKHVSPLVGPPPLDLLDDAAEPPRKRVTHATRDKESLAYARAVADKLQKRPDIIDDAVQFIDRRTPLASKSEALALGEWRDILTTYSPGRLRNFLVSDSVQSNRLRQSMPFSAALSEAERKRAKGRP